MSSRLTAPDSGLRRLVDEGYEAVVHGEYLLVQSVPYVTAAREVQRATLVCRYLVNGSTVLPPSPPGDSHQVWWTGDYPCTADGRPLAQLENEHNREELSQGLVIQHRFSNKPDGVNAFADHYQKMTHYIGLIQAQAQALQPDADARTGRAVAARPAEPVFRYADTASARAEITAAARRLMLGKVAIVGLGGTGSYVLDQVAKTPVTEVHLFDGDIFEQHNAFRCPGAATKVEIDSKMPKTEYLQGRYDAMHRGVVSHPYFLDNSNITELDGFDFVFVCVDRGSARRLLHGHLQARGTPFVDVGMNLLQVPGTSKLVGTCRVTLWTPEHGEHLSTCVPTDEDDDDTLYRQNIQVADMNALNAQLAVIKWKQHLGFYADDHQPYNTLFSVNATSLARSVLLGRSEP